MDNMVKMKAPEGSSGCSHEGISYQAKDGIVEVPRAAVEALKSHGFTLYTEAAPALVEKEKKGRGKKDTEPKTDGENHGPTDEGQE